MYIYENPDNIHACACTCTCNANGMITCVPHSPLPSPHTIECAHSCFAELSDRRCSPMPYTIGLHPASLRRMRWKRLATGTRESVYLWTCVYIYTYILVDMCTYTHTYLWTCVYIHLHTCGYVYIYTYILVDMCTVFP